MSHLVMMVCLFLTAATFAQKKPVGFLWYNLKELRADGQKYKKPGVPFHSLSYTKRDEVLHYYTMEALHRAHYTHSMKDMRTFLRLQDYWMRESSRFKELFQKTLLYYPELDYSVTHPTSAIGAQLMDTTREKHDQQIVRKLAKTHGLLFFYRGKNAFDQRQVAVMHDFCRRFALHLISVSVDGARAPKLAHSRVDKGQAEALGVHYFPAVLLVHPKTQKVLPVAYGFTTQDVLMENLVSAARTID